LKKSYIWKIKFKYLRIWSSKYLLIFLPYMLHIWFINHLITQTFYFVWRRISFFRH
jgi:hypothetical protein